MGEDGVTVSSEEVKKIEAAVKQKEAEQVSAIQRETEDKVRRELEAAQKLKEVEAQKAKMEDEFKKQSAELERLKKESDDRLKAEVEKRLQDELARSKATVQNRSPFDSQKPNIPLSVKSDDVPGISERSYEAFKERSLK